MRAFIAIDMPTAVAEELEKVQKQLSQISGLKAKFVEKENFHLTLKFLGEISDVKVNQLKEKLKAVKLKPFKATLGKLGVFPSQQFIRVIWVSLVPEEKFKELSTQISSLLGSKDERFEAHVTLARVKMVEDKAELQNKLQEVKFEKKGFEVQNFKLKQSTLTLKGPLYEDVLTFA